MEYKSIKWQIKNNVGYITLSAPPKNEMNTVFFKEFSHLINEIKTSNSLLGIIINAEGRHFSSGANIAELLAQFKQSTDRIPQPLKENSIAFQELSNLPMPVIACIKGVCFGSGFELALCANFRIATPNALLSLPETGFNIIPGLAGIYNTQQYMGTAETMQFVLSGDTISAKDAQKKGLIDIFAEKNELETRALEIINLIGENYKKELKISYLRLFNELHAQ